MGFFGGSDEQEQETKSRQQLWGPAVAGMQAGARQMEDYIGMGQTPYEQSAIGSLTAGAEAYPGMLQQYTQPGMQAMQAALGAPGAALGMGLQDVYQNPALAAQADVIQERLNRNLTEGILPGIRGGQAMRGTLGSQRQGIGEALAGRGTQEALGSALADLYGGAWQQGLQAETARYGQGLGAAGQAMGQLPQMANLGLSQYTMPAQLQMQAGGLSELPYERAMRGMGALMEPASAFGERTSTMTGMGQQTPSGMSSMGNILGMAGGVLGSIYGGPVGGMAGSAIGSKIGGMFGGGGAAAGGGGGVPYSGGMGSMSGIMGGFR